MKSINEPKIKTTREYDQVHDELLIRAVKKYGSRKAVDQIDSFLAKRSLSKFSLLNSHARLSLRSNLQINFKKMWPKLTENRFAMSLFTIVHNEWLTNEANFKVDLVDIKRSVRNAFRGWNFIATIEHAVYANKRTTVAGKKAKCVSVHVHAIVWDTSQRQIERKRKKIENRFSPIFKTHTSPVRCDKRVGLNDLLDTVGYMSKLDLSTNRLTSATEDHQTTGKTTLQSRFRRYEQLKDELLFHYWFAGGQGSPILRSAINACRNGSPLQKSQIDEFLKDYEPGERKRRSKRMTRNKIRSVRQTQRRRR